MPSPSASKNLPFGAGPVAFVDVLRNWRAKDNLEGLELDGSHARAAKEDA
jgi:cyclohexanone monooxygenase